ncbi:helix-turn-helix domain-containing protein [Pantoea agglomerans]|uniref:helix-turn-helix domain-containing protein n=1 Tax=Enterobacter agglomerans TaxID=549 RepID=UPI00241338D0|nr:helix-turn-helix domain-containing protein [Pantoea agglomerans]
MGQIELDRIPVLQQLCDKHLTQLRAAKLLDRSVRQVQRLLSRYQTDGVAGLSSRRTSQHQE